MPTENALCLQDVLLTLSYLQQFLLFIDNADQAD